jgi:uncharacterized protein YndB with AHSA1/START domain
MNGTNETTLRLERLIPSPPELLFALFVEPEQLIRWWAPDGYEAAVDVLDVRPSGRWRMILNRADGARLVNSGVYRVIEPPRRLAFTFAWEDPNGTRGHETDVTMSFEPAPGGTRLVLTQRSFESKQARDNHYRGWSACLDRIGTIAHEMGRRR